MEIYNNIVPRSLSEKEIENFKNMLLKLQSKPSTSNIKKLRCAIYARKSQEDSTGFSLPTQIDYCKALIKSSELLECTYIFQEDNKSGMWVENRDQFNKMFDLVIKQEIDVIVCYKWDRFSRKTAITGLYWEKAKQNNVYILCGDDTFYVDSAASQFSQTIFFATAELFARQSAERTMDSMLKRAREGIYESRPPFGYKIIKENERSLLNIDPIEGSYVLQIYTKFSNGESCDSIAKWLNINGILTKSNSPFTRSSVDYILRNSIYNGLIKYNRKGGRKRKNRILLSEFDEVIAQNDNLKIINDALFNKVQSMLINNSIYTASSSGHVYLLSGLIKCSNCNHLLIGESHTGGRSKVRRYYYECPHKKLHSCTSKAINAEYIENVCLDIVVKVCNDALQKFNINSYISNQLIVLGNQSAGITQSINRMSKELSSVLGVIQNPNASETLKNISVNKANEIATKIDESNKALLNLEKEKKYYSSLSISENKITKEMLMNNRQIARTLCQYVFKSIEYDGKDITFVLR